jgi:hypothetical protein
MQRQQFALASVALNALRRQERTFGRRRLG